MYLTNEKKLNYSLSGSYYTRKWNDCCPYVYFEKVYGGHSLLKKAANISKYNEILLVGILQFGAKNFSGARD